MTERTPILVKRKKHWPYMWATLEVTEIDHLDTVTIYGLDPTKAMYCKVVDAEALTDITTTLVYNIVQINQISVSDKRVIIFAYGMVAP